MKGTDGYVAISRLWKAGDKIEVQLGMQLREEATKDDASKVALLYEPIVMAGKLDKVEHPFSNPQKYNDYYTFDNKPLYCEGKSYSGRYLMDQGLEIPYIHSVSVNRDKKSDWSSRVICLEAE